MNESQNGWRLLKDFQIPMKPEGVLIMDMKKILW